MIRDREKLVCPKCAQNRIRGAAGCLRLLVAARLREMACTTPEQRKRPPAAWGALAEPPIGIEPMTYSLRGVPVMSIQLDSSGRIQARGRAHHGPHGTPRVDWSSTKRVATLSLH